MERLYEEKRIRECMKCTTVHSMRNALSALVHETPDVSVLESETDNEEMMVMIKRKGWDKHEQTTD